MQKLEMCIEVLKLAIEFLISFFEAVGSVLHQTNSSNYPTSSVPVLYTGILP